MASNAVAASFASSFASSATSILTNAAKVDSPHNAKHVLTRTSLRLKPAIVAIKRSARIGSIVTNVKERSRGVNLNHMEQKL